MDVEGCVAEFVCEAIVEVDGGAVALVGEAEVEVGFGRAVVDGVFEERVVRVAIE